MSTGGGAGYRWERLKSENVLKDGEEMRGNRQSRKSCWQRREVTGGFRELALKDETQSHLRTRGQRGRG